MRFRRRRGMEIAELVGQYLARVEEAVATMARGIGAALDGGPWDAVEELAVLTHRAESRADDLRRELERELVRGAYLAGTRRTLLDIVEGTDQVANAAEAAVDFLALQRVSLPPLLHPLVRDALDTVRSQVVDVREAVEGLLRGDPGVVARAEEVDRKESRVDDLYRRAVSRLFAIDLPLAEKILVREFLEKLAAVSDRAEDVGDLVVLAVAVRHP
ncbi:MAG: DUF47 family protein [Candidatus Bipolaricaulota bacterium]|nr:DUF47 family protein [Candidatus Bipolaricaulota bacterium]